jgi:hypothetical protein
LAACSKITALCSFGAGTGQLTLYAAQCWQPSTEAPAALNHLVVAMRNESLWRKQTKSDKQHKTESDIRKKPVHLHLPKLTLI